MIESFTGEYRFLSNFWLCKIMFEGVEYPSTEHAYVAAKTLKQEDRIKISKIETAGKAKRYGREVLLRDDWDSVKLLIMEDLLRYKFTHHKNLKEKLLATYPKYLKEGNYHNDKIWGVCLKTGEGTNLLGKILMNVRDELLDGLIGSVV